jgi:hypothetical protein
MGDLVNAVEGMARSRDRGSSGQTLFPNAHSDNDT